MRNLFRFLKKIVWIEIVVIGIFIALPKSGLAQNPLNGTFLEIGYLTTTNISAILDELKSFDESVVIIQALRQRNCSSASYTWANGLPQTTSEIQKIIDALLSKAKENGISVYLGTSLFLDYWSCSSFFNESNTKLAISDLAALDPVLTVAQKYSSFAGWYISEEPAIASWSDIEFNSSIPYYRGIAKALKAKANKPIIVSPYLNGAVKANITPDTLAVRALDFKNRTDIDIEAWQDSVGTDAIKLTSKAPERATEYSLDQYFMKLSEKIGRGCLWAVPEMFNFGVKQGKSLSNDFFGGYYHSASLMRLNQQMSLESSAWVSARVAWTNLSHMTKQNFTYGTMPEAVRMFETYKAVYGLGNRILRPASYKWITPPNSNYNDFANNKLFDSITGDPKYLTDTAWVGIPAWTYTSNDLPGVLPDVQFGGKAEVQINFSLPQYVDWVGVHSGNFNKAGVYFPMLMDIFCQATTTSPWKTLGSWGSMVSQDDSEYVLSNIRPLDAQCSSIRIRLERKSWIFLSEVEIVGH